MTIDPGESFVPASEVSEEAVVVDCVDDVFEVGVAAFD